MRAEEAQLVVATLTGDVAAFTELVDRYRDAVAGVAYHHLGSFEDAQDAAQEVFVRAYLRLRQLREPAKFGPWLRRIAATVCADFLRRRGNRLVSLEAMGEPGEEADLERAAARLVVRQALAKLSEKVRLTTTLFYINGYSHAEIAGFLEVPVNTVRSRLHRARRQLREEMTEMVSEVLHEDKPDPGVTREIVEAAISLGVKAHQAHDNDQARHHYDEALAKLTALPVEAVRQRLRMDALWKKGDASQFSPGWAEAVQYYEQALAIAEETGLVTRQAAMLAHIGVIRSNMGQRDGARRRYQQALELYRQLEDPQGQALCLFWLASSHLFDKEPALARPLLEEALPLVASKSTPEAVGWATSVASARQLLQEVPEDRFAGLVYFSASLYGLMETDGVVSAGGGGGGGIGSSDYKDAPPALTVQNVLHEVSHLGKLLDASVPVGESWSGPSFSYSFRPLHTTVTVKSNSEVVNTPAGTFESCLLMEQTTRERGESDEAEPRKHELNRTYRCGTRRAWYAPGAGLVQLHVLRGDGAEATLQLQEYEITGGSGYLPLSLGNRWSYGWADIPEEYVAKEHYRVRAHRDDVWYLEHYAYQYRR